MIIKLIVPFSTVVLHRLEIRTLAAEFYVMFWIVNVVFESLLLSIVSSL